MTEPGLRERKKAATRATLSRTAWRMMLDHGLDAVTPESVAAAADIAPRTFRYHFRNREEAILDELAKRHLEMADRVRARPAAETAWEALLAVVPTTVTDIAGNRTEFARLIRVIADSPALLAENLLMLERSRVRLAQAVSERTGPGLLPGLLAGAVTNAISVAVTHWATGDADLPELVTDCLHRFREGLS